MRVLVISNQFFKADKMEAVSFITMTMALLKEILKIEPEWRFCWAVNFRGDVETVQRLVERIDDDRIEVVPIGVDRSTAERSDVLSASGSIAKTLAQWNGKRFYDVIFSHDPACLPYFADLLMDHPAFHVKVPMVAWFGVVKALPYAEMRRFQVHDVVGMMDTWAATYSHAFVCPSPYTLEAVHEVAKRCLSPSLYIQEFAPKGRLISHAIEIDRIDRYRVERPARKPVLFSAGSLVPRKRAREVLQVYRDLQAAYGSPIIVSTASTIPDWLDGMSGVEIRQPAFSDYLKGLFDGDVFLCASKTEAFGLSNMEQLHAGQLGVFVWANWLKELLPDDYPFIASDLKEAKLLLGYIVREYEEAKKQVTKVRDWVASHYHIAIQARRFVDLFKEVDKSFLSGVRLGGGLASLAESVAQSWGGGTLDEFMILLNEQAERPQGKQRRFYIRHLLRSLGYKEDGQGILR